MTRLARLLHVVFALVAAGITALFVLVVLGLDRSAAIAAGEAFGRWRFAYGVFGHLRELAAWSALVPPVALVMIGELARIRSLLFYAVGGAAALACLPMAVTFARSGAVVLPRTDVLQLAAAAGLAGGYVYWWLAGRHA